MSEPFHFIQQKLPTSVSGEMNAYWYSIQWGFKPLLNKVEASGGCHRFSEGIYPSELDKIWAQIRQGAFDHSSGIFLIKSEFICCFLLVSSSRQQELEVTSQMTVVV